jgi:hypothetical protein
MPSTELKAPKDKFRLVLVDTFDNEDWCGGDFNTLDLAKKNAGEETEGKQMLKAHIYDDQGCHVGEDGSF